MQEPPQLRAFAPSLFVPFPLLQVLASSSSAPKSQSLLFRDGAVATACLPAYLADHCLRGELAKTGLLTPLDLIDPARLPEITEGALLAQT